MTAATSSPIIGESRSAARILIFGGILLVIAGMVLGEVFAIFISHLASAEIRRDWIGIVSATTHPDPAEAGAHFDRIQRLLERRGRIMDAHSHMIAYGFLALVLAVVQPVSTLSEKIRRRLAVSIVAGGSAQSVFVFIGYYTASWVLVLSDIGGVVLLIGIVGNIAGLFGAIAHSSIVAGSVNLDPSGSSRILLLSGGFLILLGMAFGLCYAWIFVTQHEPQQMSLLDQALTSATSGDTESGISSVIAYRGLQSRMAIITAAHSHVIEMGMLAMLLGLLQEFVFLSPAWKRRWAIVFCVGSAAMPVCTYIASRAGLTAAGFADFFGLIGIVALFATLFGVVRYTGAYDRGLAV